MFFVSILWKPHLILFFCEQNATSIKKRVPDRKSQTKRFQETTYKLELLDHKNLRSIVNLESLKQLHGLLLFGVPMI